MSRPQPHTQTDQSDINHQYFTSSSIVHLSSPDSTLPLTPPHTYHTVPIASAVLPHHAEWSNGYSYHKRSFSQIESQSHYPQLPSSMEAGRDIYHTPYPNIYHDHDQNVHSSSNQEAFNSLPPPSLDIYSELDSIFAGSYAHNLSHLAAVPASKSASSSAYGSTGEAQTVERYAYAADTTYSIPPDQYYRYPSNPTFINTRGQALWQGQPESLPPSGHTSSSTTPYVASSRAITLEELENTVAGKFRDSDGEDEGIDTDGKYPEHTIVGHSDCDTTSISTMQGSSAKIEAQTQGGKYSGRTKPQLQLDKYQPLTSHGKKRERVLVACDRCRTRKLRCTGSRPACHFCVIHGLAETCTYTSEPRRRGPDKVQGSRRHTSNG